MDYLEYKNYLCHHGIKGQKWGVRRFQNADGSLTPEGEKRYGVSTDDFKKVQEIKSKAQQKAYDDWDSGSDKAFENRNKKLETDKKDINDAVLKMNNSKIFKDNNLELSYKISSDNKYDLEEPTSIKITNKKTGKSCDYDYFDDISYTLTDDLGSLDVKNESVLDENGRKELENIINDLRMLEMDMSELQQDPHYGRNIVKYDYGNISKETISKIEYAMKDIKNLKLKEYAEQDYKKFKRKTAGVLLGLGTMLLGAGAVAFKVFD